MSRLSKEQVKHFQHRLSPAQLEQAKLAPKNSYPQKMPCVMCARPFMAHYGLVCPTQDGDIEPVFQNGAHMGFIVKPPVFDGVSLFVPDEDYYKEANFDVA